MSSQNNRFWTLGTLKSRGWTNNLTRALLPAPRIRHANNRRILMWEKEVVLAAENDPRFREQAALPRQDTPAADIPLDDALTAAKALLEEAWSAASDDGTPGYTLASHYHAAIIRQIPAVAWAERLKPGQSAGRVDNFLSINGSRGLQSATAVIKNFVTAAPWLGKNPGSVTAVRLREQYAEVLLRVAGLVLEDFSAQRPEADAAALVGMEDFPVQELLTQSLSYIYSVDYVPRAIRHSLEFLSQLHPKDEYPEARAMKRHFIVHIGGTNTGKTYAGFQRLIRADTGVYLAPLRLLALEAQELLLDNGVACSLTTGEEEDKQDTDTHVAATAEKLDMDRRFDVAVIDECQMIADPERGYAWTRAILGVLAPEVHLCCAPEARSLLLRIIQSCGDTFEVVEHERKTPLICMNRQIDYSSIRPGDALITFSKIGVLSIAEDLRSRGCEPAIIYGALPYSTRRKQMEGFLAGDMQYVVSTDAIGMGLNLPIRRVIFMETEKFDGHERRELKPAEIQQIAGRAGRYGMYDKGYVGAMEDLSLIRAGLEAVVPPLQHAVVGFSDLIIRVDFDLLEVLEVWMRIPTPDPYIKLDVSRYVTLISRLRQAGFQLTKEQELRTANIPFDETDPELSGLLLQFLQKWQDGQEIARPALPVKQTAHTLPELEQYCRKLDLYFSFSKAFDIDVDRDALYDERERVAEQINQILLHNLKNNIRFCVRCGAALPLHHKSRLCDRCFTRQYGRQPRGPRRKK